MERTLVEVKDDDGGSFWVEAEVSPSAEPVLAGSPESQLEARVEGLQNLIRRLARNVTESVRDLEVGSAELEVGIKLGGEAGNAWFLAKATGEATVKVKLVWSPAAQP